MSVVNEFDIIIFCYTRNPFKVEKVRMVEEVIAWLEKNREQWKYMNVYDHNKRAFVKRVYRNRQF